MNKLYSIYYQEIMTYETSVYAESNAEAREKFEHGVRVGSIVNDDAEIQEYFVEEEGEDLYVD